MAMSLPAQWISTTPDAPWKRRPSAPARGQVNLALNGQMHQRWDGFGGCFNELGWIALSSLKAQQRRAVMASLFEPADSADSCRFNFCRLPIGASDYAYSWYSCNEHAGDFEMKYFSLDRDKECLIPYIKSALAFRKDLQLFASPWSPPTWLKHPPVYNYGTMIWDKRHLAAYALYLTKFVQAYSREGVTIDQVHVQNEPRGDQKFPSCLWTGEKMRDFIRDYLGPAFSKAKLPCEIWLGTLNCGDPEAYANLVFSDPKARAYVSGVGYQWEGKFAIQRTHESHPDKRLMQTENECGDGANTWDYAQYIFSLIRHYISNGANAYIYWNMILQSGGESSWGWPQNSMITIDRNKGTVRYNPEYFVMKHCSAFIERGAVRLGLKGSWAGNALAFTHEDGRLAVIANNPLDVPRPLNFSTGRSGFSAELPAKSINTFVLQS